jgi:hypothetical protein
MTFNERVTYRTPGNFWNANLRGNRRIVTACESAAEPSASFRVIRVQGFDGRSMSTTDLKVMTTL